MGLDDIPGVNKDSSSSSSGSSKQKSPEEDDDFIVIGSDPHKKTFERDYWENEVAPVIRHEFGMNVNEVLNKPAKERYEIIHEAATWSGSAESEEQKELETSTRCDICGMHADEASIVLEARTPGGEFRKVRSCVHHPIARTAKVLGQEFEDGRWGWPPDE